MYTKSNFIEADKNLWCIGDLNLEVVKWNRETFILHIVDSPLTRKELDRFKTLSEAKKAYLLIANLSTEDFNQIQP